MTLYQARQDAFEFASDDQSVLSADVGIYPWALTPQEFASAQASLASGEVPHTRLPESVDFAAALTSWKKYTGPIIVFLKRGAGRLKVVGEFLGETNVWVDVALISAPPVISGVNQGLNYLTVQNSKRLFAIDAKRRAAVGEASAAAQATR